MITAISLVALALLIAAGAWDLYVIFVLEAGKPWADRIASGLTASYRTYVAARAYPPVGWLIGFASAFVALFAWRCVALGWFLVVGHIVFTMRDVP